MRLLGAVVAAFFALAELGGAMGWIEFTTLHWITILLWAYVCLSQIEHWFLYRDRQWVKDVIACRMTFRD